MFKHWKHIHNHKIQQITSDQMNSNSYSMQSLDFRAILTLNLWATNFKTKLTYLCLVWSVCARISSPKHQEPFETGYAKQPFKPKFTLQLLNFTLYLLILKMKQIT